MDKIIPCLWFDGQADEAARYYVSLFDDASIRRTSYYGEGAPRPRGEVLTVEFELEGRPFVALNAGPEFKFNEAVSFQVMCEDQAEVDRFRDSLSKDGETSVCGWLKDKFGLSWQIVPRVMLEFVTDPDPLKVDRAMQAMMRMTKLDIAALQRAYDG